MTRLASSGRTVRQPGLRSPEAGIFPKRTVPTAGVYGATATPQLVLITFGGKYDADRRYYDANGVVWARLVTVPG